MSTRERTSVRGEEKRKTREHRNTSDNQNDALKAARHTTITLPALTHSSHLPCLTVCLAFVMN